MKTDEQKEIKQKRDNTAEPEVLDKSSEKNNFLKESQLEQNRFLIISFLISELPLL